MQPNQAHDGKCLVGFCPTPDKLVLGRCRCFYVFAPLTLSISALAHHGQLKLCVARRRASCVPPFGMALRALMARFKMAAVNKDRQAPIVEHPAMSYRP
jgi:hypothetical protein